jgi:hypothetical protein
MSGLKVNPDHKFRVGVTPTCSCGWVGAVNFGKGARTAATWDWRTHRERCEAAQRKEPRHDR